MRIVLLAVSNRQPGWVEEGYREYARRMRGSLKLELIEVPLARRSQSSPVEKAREEEGARLLAAIPRGAHVVALTVDGTPWSTAQLARRLADWMGGGAPLCLMIGGPDGLSSACLERADERWSLSSLTLPHGLVRVIVAEALYRARSLLQGHPYHRS